MAVEWCEVDKEVLRIAEEVIAEYHPELQDCSIGFLFRSEGPVSAGKVTLGKARKIPAEQRVYMDYDFVIWLAEDWWRRLKPEQRVALIDHELTHCRMDDEEKAWIAPHDVEEFNCIIERHGFWWPQAEPTMKAVQATLISMPSRVGRIGAVTLSEMAREGGL